jgi:hypothetical protein
VGAEARHPQVGEAGEWANLCDEHHAKMENRVQDALDSPGEANIKRLLGSWVRASGGGEAMLKGRRRG